MHCNVAERIRNRKYNTQPNSKNDRKTEWKSRETLIIKYRARKYRYINVEYSGYSLCLVSRGCLRVICDVAFVECWGWPTDKLSCNQRKPSRRGFQSCSLCVVSILNRSWMPSRIGWSSPMRMRSSFEPFQHRSIKRQHSSSNWGSCSGRIPARNTTQNCTVMSGGKT